MRKREGKKILAKAVNISKGHLDNVLRGDRNMRYRVAKKMAILTDTDPEIWVDPDQKKARGPAYERYEKEHGYQQPNSG